ncbi:hypothetical protein T492DRAFT_1078519 [Pavlovales sp. CCMP2436]|nr:hypothetical protein T492DRAFT_1078519 [Pavlovales sp. CCMP2436]
MEVDGVEMAVSAGICNPLTPLPPPPPTPPPLPQVYPDEGPYRCTRLAQMRMQMPFGDLRATLSNKEEAQAAAVKVEGQVNEAYEVRMRVKLRDASQQTLDLPSAGYQSVVVEEEANGRVQQALVTVNLQAPLKATVLINLAATVRKTLSKRAGKLEVAYALREFAYEHIETKDLTTAFASASEVARTKAGDCTEHAVLLAALLRTQDIPARVCHGLVYVERYADEIERDGTPLAVSPDSPLAEGEGEIKAEFGWHMWTQAMVDGVWVDLDATLHVPYNVGHILVGTSSMADVEGHYQHMGMAGLIGNLDMDLTFQRYDPNGPGHDEL